MSATPARLRTADRAALVALCLLLAVSMTAKVHAYRTESSEQASATVDLGAGVFLPRDEAAHRAVWVSSCPDPVAVDFVDPSPHGEDASLAAPLSSDDRVFYVYRGWTLDGRFAATELGALHFARRAAGVLWMGGDMARRELAAKLAISANCDASPKDALAALRREVQG